MEQASDLEKIFSPKVLNEYRERLVRADKWSQNTIERKLASLRKFCQWATSEKYLKVNPLSPAPKSKLDTIAQSFFAPLSAAKSDPTPKKILHFLRYSRPKWYKDYHALPLSNYLHLAILIIFCSALGFGLYQQFIARPPEKPTLATIPTSAPLYLSFQGRLTDSVDNPITSSTQFVFKIYNVSGGGSALWTETKNITPDQDGIFNSLLGDTTALDRSVFRDNTDLYLGVTVGVDAEMTPRQRIATVAYAFNAEYLQGYDLAKATNADPTATGGATINTVPIINPSGNLVIAAASPTIWSTSGTFGLKGQAVTISTPDTSNGSITVNPDGSGVLNLTFEGSTGKFINATNANIGGAGGKEANALFYGYAGTDSTNYNLLKLESGSSAVPKFTVDASGNASAAGTLKTLSTAADALDVAGGIYAGTADAFKVNTSGAITAGAWQGTAVGTQYGGTGQDWSAVAQGSVPYFSGTGTMATLGPSTSGYVLTTQGAGANPTWSDISASGGPWTTANGTLYPDNSTLDLLIGGAATTSAKFAFTNVLTGTPTATFSGNLVLAGGSRTISATDMNNLTIGNSSTQNLLLNPNSNVGVGTTNPLQKLHVEGQCVAEDSLIPTLKSSANLKFEIFNFQSNSNDLILKQIKNIEAGDQVLSLNEHAGQFEWQKVEKTLDMGVREVYELITESGKRIETTGNHPYLARRLFSGKFSKEDKSQENHDQSYSPTDIYLSRQISKINHSFSKISSSLTANVIDTIPSNRESVKTENSLTVSGRIRRPDPTLVNTAESTLSWEGRNAIEKPINESVEESKNIVNRLAKSKWIKVAYLKVGDEIATLDGWEKVVSLKITGRKHVYDLQIANTHNFVANGIVAHNTYISSNVGIGTTSPSYQLQLSADSAAKPTSSTWTIASDIRIKDVVGPYNRGLAEILQINPILYTYKENNALGIIDPGQHIGIAAQEVQKVIPEAIATDSGGYLHFTADPLNWAMVNAIKEQQEQIASLSGQLATANEAITSLSKANLSEQEIIVSDLNGPIKIGDPITSSEIPGVGMKSTRAGPIVGKALEPFDPATGKGEIIECPNDYNNNNNYKCGKIMAFVNVSWFDPGVFLTSTGDLQITKETTNSAVLADNDAQETQMSNVKSQIYNLKLKTGETIERVGVFSEAAIANLQTGIAETRQLIAGTANVEEKIVSPVVETGTIRSGFGDLVISLDRYPANQDSESSEIASSSAFGKLLVKGVNNEVVASIDAEGNARLAGDLQARQASFAGQVTVNKLESERVTSDELVSETATITGTLYANKIESEEISALTGKFGEILARMEKVESQALPPDQSLTPNLIPTPTPEPTASSSALLAEVDAFVKELLASQAELGWAQAASVSADLKIADNITVNSEQLTVNSKFAALGSASLADTTIAGNLLVDGTLSLSANSIASLGPLYLSSAEGIDFLAGKVVINKEGNVTIENNLAVKGSLFTNLLKPLPGQDLTIDLASNQGSTKISDCTEEEKILYPDLCGDNQDSGFGMLLVRGVGGATVASFDAEGNTRLAGDLVASGSGTFDKIIIASANPIVSTSDLPAGEAGVEEPRLAEGNTSEVKNNASAGTAVLPAGETALLIANNSITNNSLVYLTPLSSTENKVLFVRAKSAPGSGTDVEEETANCETGEEGCQAERDDSPAKRGWFEVALDSPIEHDIQFNWWVIN